MSHLPPGTPGPFEPERVPGEGQPEVLSGYGQGGATGASGYGAPSGDVLADGGAPRRGGGTRQKLVIGGAALGVVLVGGTAYGAVQFMSGGGSQPEDSLPADTIAVGKVDFDPSAGQKVAVLRLARNFPQADKGSSTDDLKTTIGKSLDDNDYGLDYERDIAPWIGRRFAAAAVPDSSAKDKVAPVLALAFTDEGKMRNALTKARATATKECAGAATCSGEFGFAVRGDYVLVSGTQAQADRIAKATTKLSGSKTYQGDVASLDSDQVAVGWVDIKAAYNLASGSERSALAAQLGSLKPTGRFVVGAHAASDYLEVEGRGRGITQLQKGQSLAQEKGNGLAGAFPSDTQAAMSVTGLGPFLEQVYATYKKEAGLDLDQYAQQLDLQLPGDLGALFGSDLAVGGKGGADADALPTGAVHVRTAKGARAVEVLDDLLPQLGQDVKATRTKDGYELTLPAGAAAAFGSPSKRLADSAAFKKAAPAAADAAAVVYVNVGELVDRYGSAQDKKDYEHIGSFGMTAKGGTESSFTLRLTTR